MSGCMASRFLAVSRSDSPFDVALVDEEMLITSAESLLPAISKLVRVRVEFSKKTLMTVLPLSVGTFLMARLLTSAKRRAVSRMPSISSRDKSAMPSMSLRLSFMRVSWIAYRGSWITLFDPRYAIHDPRVNIRLFLAIQFRLQNLFRQILL